MKKSFFIEFIGMPGCGKSYYSNKIKKLLKNEGLISNHYDDLSKIKKFLFFLLFLFANFKLTLLNIIYFYTQTSKSNEFAKHLYYFKNESALRIYHQINTKRVINSEGFRHRSIYFIYENLKKNSKFSYKEYLNLLPKIDLLIYIKSIKKNNIDRTKKRKKQYKYNKNEIENYDIKENIIEKIVKESKKKVNIVYIRNNHEVKNLNIIKNKIKNLC